MDYKTIADARDMPGLRLVLQTGVPGPWAEAIKSVFNYKGIPFTAVQQEPGGPNEDLQAWTGQTTAPVAVYESEAPRITWLDQLMLAEQLAPGKPLLPVDLEQRAMVTGLCREIAGERGLGWNRRLQLLAPALRSPEPPEAMLRMGAKYGWSEQECAEADQRVAECFKYFATRLRMQQRLQSDYLVGAELTAVDLYLANFLGMFSPLPPDLNPMPDYLREIYSTVDESLESCLEPILFEHRDRIYERHISTPLEF